MTIKNSLFALFGLVVVAGLVAFTLVFKPDLAKGSVTVFTPQNCYTAAATGTPVVVGVGSATTTLACDLGYEGAQEATLEIIYAASSSAAILVTQIEYADVTPGVNCATNQNGCTWYANNQDVFAAGAIAIATPSNSFTWTFASSTIGGVTPLSSPPCFAGQLNRGDCSNKIVSINAPTQYVRAVFSATVAPAAIRAKIVPRTPVN